MGSEMCIRDSYLGNAPKEFSVDISSEGLPLFLPMPDGQMQKFSIVESSLMPDNLAVKFPSIKSYVGQGIDDKTATVRMSVDHNGFHAMVISTSGTVYIDPYSLNNKEFCITYYKKDFYATNTKVREQVGHVLTREEGAIRVELGAAIQIQKRPQNQKEGHDNKKRTYEMHH